MYWNDRLYRTSQYQNHKQNLTILKQCFNPLVTRVCVLTLLALVGIIYYLEGQSPLHLLQCKSLGLFLWHGNDGSWSENCC